MSAILFENVSKRFGATGSYAVRDVSFDVGAGDVVVLLGPSGCGKTTLMRMVNRLIEPSAGHIYLNGTEIHELKATELRRRIGYVIQQTGLFPHMTVAANVATVPRLLHWDRTRINARVDELLDLVDLPPTQYRSRYPSQLSGGQQQRVGIARAMAADPAVMLMDEPFGAIDAITRTDLQNELLAIQRKVSKTIMFVTHDVDEALRLGSRIAVMRAGEVVQYGTPLEILTEPADDFVRTLLATDDVFRHLSLIPVSTLVGPTSASASGLTVPIEESARVALSLLINRGADEALVVDSAGRPAGSVTLQGILQAGRSEHYTPTGV